MSIDEESDIKKEMFVMEKTGMHRFYCEICEVACSSQLTLNGHYAGKKHQRVLRKNVVTGKEISKQSLLQEKTNKKDESVAQKNFLDIAQTEPVIGLEYIVEYRKMNSKVVPKYQCELCCIQCDTLTIYSHVCSNKHRLKYLKQHHFQRYKEITGCPNYFKQTSSVLSKKTFFHSKAVMNIYGGPEMLGNVQVRENSTGAVGQRPCIMVVPFKMPTVLNCFEEQLSQKEKDLLEKEK
uniref:U1-type domain-containing protein n=1 Tax=Ciona savignyi TaxID=51511 RepID=H2ZR49_CIOSA